MVKSAYYCVKKWENDSNIQTSVQDVDTELWNKLWTLKAQPKLLHLAWRILNNGLKVRENLVAKGVGCTQLCP